MKRDTTISRRLFALRTLKRLSQEKLCEATDIPLPSYRNWETGRNEPGVYALITLADYYQVSVDVIVGREPISISD